MSDAKWPARERKLAAKIMYCFAANSAFEQQPVSHRLQIEFEYPTNNVMVITQAARRMAKEFFRQGVRYAKVGIGLLELSPQGQMDMFYEDDEKNTLMTVYDSLNHKFGPNTIQLCSKGFKKEWSMKREFLSPAYTSKWEDIPKVSC